MMAGRWPCGLKCSLIAEAFITEQRGMAITLTSWHSDRQLSRPYAGAWRHRCNARNVRRYPPEMTKVFLGIKPDSGTIRPQPTKSAGEEARMLPDAVFSPLQLGDSIPAGESPHASMESSMICSIMFSCSRSKALLPSP